MKKLLLSFIFLFLTSCISGSYPLSISNFDKDTKVGEDCVFYSLAYPEDYRLSVDHAKSRFSIQNISYVDFEYTHFPFYHKECIKVYGE